MRTAIIKRSETATKFRNGPSKLNKKVFKKQRNFYTKRKKIKYGNLDLKKMIDNREFWKTIRIFLSNKTKMQKNMRERGRQNSIR